MRDTVGVAPSRVVSCLDGIGLHVAGRAVPLSEGRGSVPSDSAQASYGMELAALGYCLDSRSAVGEKLKGQVPKEATC
ncbi:hypothetical protein Trydic_g1513 [Trypoxylus dichotomus]